jgi:DNA polymerase-3 subunit delta'
MSLAPWLSPAWDVLAAALAAGRLHHALLLAAPAGLGKRALAEALAAAALCEARGSNGHACGTCRGCRLRIAGTHPDLVRVGLELRDDGKPRTELTVDQLRALNQRLAMSSQFGGMQVALVDPADAMNASAANALLKTLEEPASATVIVLLADDPSRLPATIRSRCQRVSIEPPSRDAALAWLGAQGVDRARAAAALEGALGNPGLALAWAGDDTLAMRDACAADLAGLGSARMAASDVAERWAADRAGTRLWLAAALACEEARGLARGEAGRLGLTSRGEIPKLAAWSGRANRARALLATTLRADLVLLDLLRGWPRRADAPSRRL